MTRATPPADGTEAAARVADVLVAVGEHGGPVGVTELSQRVALSKSVVHRILRTLEDRMLVRVAPGVPGRYTIGPAISGWGSAASLRAELVKAAAPELWPLLARARHTVTLSLLAGTGRRYVAQVAAGGLLMPTDRTLPLHAGAAGKAILAFVPRQVHERVLAGPLRALTPRTVVEADRLTDELTHVQATLVAVSSGEVASGVAGVASPVLVAGEVVGALGVCVPAASLTPARRRELTEAVRPAARRASVRLARHT